MRRNLGHGALAVTVIAGALLFWLKAALIGVAVALAAYLTKIWVERHNGFT
jgi:hypothetical protein